MPKEDQHADNLRYAVIPRVLIFVFRDNEILLIKGADTKKIWAGKYNGIGGHVEKGESVLDAVKRELKEESGVSNCDLWLSTIVMMDVEKAKGVSLFVFKGIYQSGEIETSKEGEPKWVNISSAKALPIVEDLLVLIDQIQKQEKGDPVLFARSFYDGQMNLRIVFNS